MLYIHQCSVHIQNKPGPDLYIADWLSQQNHMEKRNQQIAGLSICIHTINKTVDIPVCILIENIRAATNEDAELQMLQAHIIKVRPQNKDETEHNVGRYQQIRHDLAMTGGMVLKGK